MKFNLQSHKVTAAILMITFFVVSAARAQQNQPRPEIRIVPIPQPARTIDLILPSPTFIKGNELQAMAVKQVLPVYSPDAQRDRLFGAVIVEVNISKEGNVSSLHYMTGHNRLRDAVGTAVWGWKWDPASIQDSPQGIYGRIRFDFDENGTVSLNTSTDPAVVDPREVAKAELLRNFDQDLKQMREAPSPALYEKVGQIYFELGRIEEAVNTFKEGISLYPQNLRLYGGWAGVYMKEGKNEEWMKVLELIAQLQIGPDSPGDTREQFAMYLLFLGYAYSAKERYAEVKETLVRALSLNPSEKYRKDYYKALGQAAAKLGDEKLTISMADKLLELKDKDSAMIMLLELYKKLKELGDKRAAKAVLVLADKVCRMRVYKPITE